MAPLFAQRPAGHSIARITRALNDTGNPCPSGADTTRNPHREGRRWVLNTVQSIPTNPRCTGRQVRNRQRTDHDLVDPRTPPPATATSCAGTPPPTGSSPPDPLIPRWSARPTSSPSRTSAPGRSPNQATPISWPACCAAVCAAAAWNPTGVTAVPATGAATATPAPPARAGGRKRVPMSPALKPGAVGRLCVRGTSQPPAIRPCWRRGGSSSKIRRVPPLSPHENRHPAGACFRASAIQRDHPA
ncbi:recombinase family protein [Streptomyces hyaluromycini]|uniref:recombinase family protein n=1 Tax=Streptomyces hyaluromycini TaxID=1377993 RepID=UPI0034CD60C8